MSQIENLTSNNITIGDHTIAYDVLQGSEQPERTMILCHGAFCNKETMRVLAGQLSKVRPEDRIILVDVPWHGESTSTKSIEGADVHTYAGILKDFVEQLEADAVIKGKIAWFGWSMGGSIGMLLELAGLPIDELILVNSAPVWTELEAVVEQVPAFADPAHIKDIFFGVLSDTFKTNATDEEVLNMTNYYDALTSTPEVMANDIKAIAPYAYDVRDRLSEIKAKTLILSDENDNLATVPMQNILEENIEGSIKHIGSDNHAAPLKERTAEIIASCFAEVFVLNEN